MFYWKGNSRVAEQVNGSDTNLGWGSWESDNGSSWGDGALAWGTKEKSYRKEVKVEYKANSWSQEKLCNDLKYGWFVAKIPSNLRWSWTYQDDERNYGDKSSG